MTTATLNKTVGDERVPVVHTLTRPVAGAPKKIKVNGVNASEHADALGDIKRQIKELTETEENYTNAFKAYVRERAAVAFKKDETAAPLQSLLITGVVYTVDVKIDLESDRFQQKLFTTENPGVTKLYTKTIVYDRVDVRNVK